MHTVARQAALMPTFTGCPPPGSLMTACACGRYGVNLGTSEVNVIWDPTYSFCSIQGQAGSTREADKGKVIVVDRWGLCSFCLLCPQHGLDSTVPLMLAVSSSSRMAMQGT